MELYLSDGVIRVLGRPSQREERLTGYKGRVVLWDYLKGIVKRRGWQGDAIKAEAFFVPRDESAGPEASQKAAAKG